MLGWEYKKKKKNIRFLLVQMGFKEVLGMYPTSIYGDGVGSLVQALKPLPTKSMAHISMAEDIVGIQFGQLLSLYCDLMNRRLGRYHSA